MIGILGGTFDPIHFGHLRMAQEIGESLGLDEIRFMPAACPPHRTEPRGTAQQRAEMVKLAIAGNPLFRIDTRELERPGPSYMVDTLTSLRAEIGQDKPIFLMLGTDAFLGITTWHRWQTLFELAHIAVTHRPGFVLNADNPDMPAALRTEWHHRYSENPLNQAAGNIVLRQMTALDISASRIRKTLQHGDSPRYLMPEQVCQYIHTHHLYEKEPHGT